MICRPKVKQNWLVNKHQSTMENPMQAGVYETTWSAGQGCYHNKQYTGKVGWLVQVYSILIITMLTYVIEPDTWEGSYEIINPLFPGLRKLKFADGIDFLLITLNMIWCWKHSGNWCWISEDCVPIYFSFFFFPCLDWALIFNQCIWKLHIIHTEFPEKEKWTLLFNLCFIFLLFTGSEMDQLNVSSFV